MNLVIDIGNTVAKVAVFDGVSLLEVAYDSNRNLEHLSDIYSKYHFEKAIVATVIDLSEQVLAQLALLPIPVLWLNETTPLPVVNLYETPRTLGYDRMAAVVAANEQFPGMQDNRPVLEQMKNEGFTPSSRLLESVAANHPTADNLETLHSTFGISLPSMEAEPAMKNMNEPQLGL